MSQRPYFRSLRGCSHPMRRAATLPHFGSVPRYFLAATIAGAGTARACPAGERMRARAAAGVRAPLATCLGGPARGRAGAYLSPARVFATDDSVAGVGVSGAPAIAGADRACCRGGSWLCS